MIVQNRVAKKLKSKNLYRTKAVSQSPLAVLNANNNGVVVYLLWKGGSDTLNARGLEERRNFGELLIESVGCVHFS